MSPVFHEPMKVAIFGLGYVGTVTAACLAEQGHDVWAVDVDTEKVALVSRGVSPIVEPGVDDLIARTTKAGTLHATADVGEALDRASVSLVCVGTPSTSYGATDLSYVERAVADIARSLALAAPPPECFHSIVVRSTVPPGTVDDVVAPILEFQPSGAAPSRFGIAFCPEFLRVGSGCADFADPPFTIVGTSDRRVADAVRRMFWFLEKPVRVVDVRTAEALKYACNAFHATKVSFANEIARVMRHLDVDARSVMEIFCEDDRLNISRSYLRPSFAFGGSCLPKDLRALLHLGRINNVDLPLLNGALVSNDLTVREVADRILASDARQACLMGLSFKMETDDLRESPNVALAEILIGKGIEVRIFDPIINPARLVGANRDYGASRLPHLQRLLAGSPQEALSNADVAVVSSSEPAVIEALVACPPRLILDLDGRLGREVEALPGYSGVGW